jgi:molybdopterin adenylyltransferase
LKAAVLTVSTSKAAGEGADESGARLAELAEEIGLDVAERDVVPDDRGAIAARLRAFADDGCALVLTTGGTGFSPTDVTPEATRDVIEREAPGLAEALRLASRERARHWMLSRGVAGIRGRTLIVNFPGSPRSIGEAAEAIAGSLPHALELLAGEQSSHA